MGAPFPIVSVLAVFSDIVMKIVSILNQAYLGRKCLAITLEKFFGSPHCAAVVCETDAPSTTAYVSGTNTRSAPLPSYSSDARRR